MVRWCGGFGGVAVEGGGDGVGSGALGGEGVFEGGDVGEDGAVELGVDAGDELGPGFGGGEAAGGAVEGDDVGSCVADGFGGAEVWGDVDVAVGVVGLDDADDGSSVSLRKAAMRETPSARRPPAPPRRTEVAMRVSVSRSSSGSPSEAWQETMRCPRMASKGEVRDAFELWDT